MRKLRSMIERGHTLSALTHVTSLCTTTSNLLKARTQQATQNGDDDKAWSSQEWKSDALMDDRTERPFVCSQRASQTRFSREHKHVILEEEENHDRTEKPVVCSQRAHQFVIGDDETESDWSLGSSSFLDRVNDQVQKKAKTIFNECH